MIAEVHGQLRIYALTHASICVRARTSTEHVYGSCGHRRVLAVVPRRRPGVSSAYGRRCVPRAVSRFCFLQNLYLHFFVLAVGVSSVSMRLKVYTILLLRNLSSKKKYHPDGLALSFGSLIQYCCHAFAISLH